MKHLLVWTINDYPEMGGGLNYDVFANLSDMDSKVDELNTAHKEKLQILFACCVAHEHKYEPVDFVRKFSRIQS